MFKKQLAILFLFSFLKGFGQDSTHVSAYLRDAYFVYPFQIQAGYGSEIYKGFKYIQTIDNRVIINNQYDSLDDFRKNMDFGYNKEFNYDVSFEQNIPPSIDTVSNGKYIQYYTPIIYPDCDTLKFIRNRIAAIYYLENNLPTKTAYWFTPDEQKVYKQGDYINGKRENEWKMVNIEFMYESIKNKKGKFIYKKTDNLKTIKCTYKIGKKNGLQTLTIQINSKDTLKIIETVFYENDQKNGNYLYTENSIPFALGNYKNDLKTGEWFIYSRRIIDNHKKNKKMEKRVLKEHYTINTEKIPGKSLIIRDAMNSYPNGIIDGYYIPQSESAFSLIYNKSNLVEFNDYKNFYTINGTLKSVEHSNSNSIFGFFKYDYKKAIDSFGYTFYYLNYESYYPNGQLYSKFHLNNGSLANEDTIFWENGKVKNLIIQDTIKKQYFLKKFDETGVLNNTILFDEKGTILTLNPPQKKLFNNRLYTISYSGSTYRDTTIIPLNGIDSTYIINEEIDKDNQIIETTTYNPKLRKSTDFNQYNSPNMRKLTSIVYDSLFANSTYIEEIEFGKLKIRTTGQDTVHLVWGESGKKQEIKSYYENYIRYIGNHSESKENKIEISYNGQPFSGQFKIYITDKEEKVFIKNKQIIIYLNNLESLYNLMVQLELPDELYDLFYSYYDKYNFYKKEKKQRKKLKSTYSLCFNLEKGKFSKDLIFKYKNKKIIAQMYFENNLLEGNQLLFSGLTHKKFNINHSKQDYYISQKTNYKNGEKNGEKLIFNQFGDTILESNYLNDKLNGYYRFKSEKTYNSEENKFESETITYNYLKNSSTGQVIVKDTLGNLIRVLNYKNEYLDGKSFFYTGFGILYQTANFKENIISDSIVTYNNDNSIKQVLIYKNNIFLNEKNYENEVLHDEVNNDTTYTKYRLVLSEKTSNTLNKLYKSCIYLDENDEYYEFNNKKGYSKTYNTEGVVTKEGIIHNYSKIGLWQYNYSEPSGKYSINYVDSTIIINDTLSFYTKGVYIQKDEQGNILSKRHLLSTDILYNCAQGETYEIITYYIETEKDSSQHLRNGYLKNYYPTGVKQSEGMNKNGLPTGLWKFYNDNGSLRETGHYINGKKQGRWLSGDLAKINYMGDLCFDLDNEKMQELVTDLEKQLDIQETYYDKGIVISENHFYLVK